MSIVRELAARAYFRVSLTLGWLLRSTKYSTARIVYENGEPHVRKRRVSYAPLLVLFSDPIMKILNTGVRVLPQRDWEKRERIIYRTLHAASIPIQAGGTLFLPCLPGESLASVLDDPRVEEPRRKEAIEAAVVALAEFHRMGFTHGDAMAENVLIDAAPRRCSGRPEHLSKGAVAHWFDFETVHDSCRSAAWRRADDLRALVATCLMRTVREKRAETLRLMLDVYSDEDVTRLLARHFTSVFRRPLIFHLAQAPMSLNCFQEIGRLSNDFR